MTTEYIVLRRAVDDGRYRYLLEVAACIMQETW